MTKVKRVGIYLFYDSDGVVDTCDLYCINELKNICTKLIVVVNGIISKKGYSGIRALGVEIVVRKNEGFEAGAFKYVLEEYLSTNEVNEFEEVVLYNNSEYGPFETLQNIFDIMDKKSCDYWTIKKYRNKHVDLIEPDFMVFRNNMIKNGGLTAFFDKYTDSSLMNRWVYDGQFEFALDYYLNMDTSYLGEFFYIFDKLETYAFEPVIPFLKKKVFVKHKDNVDYITNSLSYIKTNYNYDIGMILESIKRKYNINIAEKTVDKWVYSPELIEKYSDDDFRNHLEHTAMDIRNFIKGNQFYIYGAKIDAARGFYLNYDMRDYFKGFIVSDDKDLDDDSLLGYPICHLKEVKNLEKYKVLICTSPDSYGEIQIKLSGIKTITFW